MLIRAFIIALVTSLVAATASRADQNDPALNKLFGELPEVEGLAATTMVNEIWGVWHDSGSDTIDLLMRDAATAVENGTFEQAEAQYDAVIDLAPEFAEGWNRRATLRFMRGDYTGSIEDISRVLDLEPRHFGALAGLGAIYDRLNQPDAALQSFEQALSINPHMEEIRQRVDALNKELGNQDI